MPGLGGLTDWLKPCMAAFVCVGSLQVTLAKDTCRWCWCRPADTADGPHHWLSGVLRCSTVAAALLLDINTHSVGETMSSAHNPCSYWMFGWGLLLTSARPHLWLLPACACRRQCVQHTSAAWLLVYQDLDW